MTDFRALQFIGGVFFEWELPRERLYLLRYFRTHIERSFLLYYYCFREYEHFTDHTGYYCQKRWLKLLMKRHERLVNIHDKAKEGVAKGIEEDLSLLARIEKGKFKLKG